jgi:adenylate cyclase
MRLTALVALMIVLFTLHRISKRITGPISKLASVTHDVAEGKFEGIELPQLPKRKGDEVSTLLSSFDQMIIGLQEKEKVKGILSKVVSPAIAQEITKGAIHLGGEERKVTVLFGDIHNFTRMSARKDPAQVVEMLNACMTKVSQEVDAFGGVIDKYVGDEVMALFGAPIEEENSALNAVLSALKMIEVLKEWNNRRVQDGYPPVEMSFGIHTGNVLVGNMGAENRLNYTVIGGNVNFANRLCSAAQPMEILISKKTLSEPRVQDSLILEECLPLKVKGYDEAFIVYRVKGTK